MGGTSGRNSWRLLGQWWTDKLSSGNCKRNVCSQPESPRMTWWMAVNTSRRIFTLTTSLMLFVCLFVFNIERILFAYGMCNMSIWMHCKKVHVFPFSLGSLTGVVAVFLPLPFELRVTQEEACRPLAEAPTMRVCRNERLSRSNWLPKAKTASAPPPSPRFPHGEAHPGTSVGPWESL